MTARDGYSPVSQLRDAGSIPSQNVWELCGQMTQDISSQSNYKVLRTSVQHCYILIFIFMHLLSEGQAGEKW